MAQSSDEIDRFLAEHPDIKFVDALMFDLVGEAVGKRYGPGMDLAPYTTKLTESAQAAQALAKVAAAGAARL